MNLVDKEDLIEALKSLFDQNVSYHGPEIRIPAPSHGAAIECVRRIRAIVAKLEKDLLK